MAKIIIILLCFFSVSCSADHSLKVTNFLAVEDYNNKKYDSAIEKFYDISLSKKIEMIKTKEEFQDYARYNLALSYLAIAESQGAKKIFTDLTSSNIRKIKSLSYFQIGYEYFKNKNYNQALQAFKFAVEIDYDFTEAKINYEICLKLLEEKNTNDNNGTTKKQIKNEKMILEYIKAKEVQLWQGKNEDGLKKLPYDY